MRRSTLATPFQAGSVLLLLALAGAAPAADPEFPSLWRTAAIAVDGNADDWAGRLVPVPETPLTLGIQNDGTSLYLCLKTSDEAAKKRIREQGVIFFLDASGKADRSFGVRYPAAPPPASGEGGPRPEEGGQLVRIRRQASGAEVQVLGRDAEGGGQIKATGTAPLAAAMDEKDGILVLELKVPLSFGVETPFAIHTAPGRTIALGLEGGQPGRELRSDGARAPRGGGASDGGVSVGRGGVVVGGDGGTFRAGPGGASVGFGGGGRGGSGGRGGQGRPAGGRPAEGSAGVPVKKWFQVRLAEDPVPGTAPAGP